MARYQPNFGEVRKWLDTDRGLRRVVTSQANLIATRARILAPVLTGEYKSKIKVRRSRGWDGRIAANVTAEAEHSTVVEKGRRSIEGRGHHVLRRAAESL